MMASGIGTPSVLKTRPSTYKYSPLPSDAMDSPLPTAVLVHCGTIRVLLVLLTVWSVIGVKRTKYTALRSVADRGVIESVH